MPRLNTVIMVPKGAEFKAVQKGLRSASSGNPAMNSLKLVPLPVGPEPVKAFLSQWCQTSRDITPETPVILMGLCGSLTPRLGVKDAVIYERCVDGVSGQSARLLSCRNDFFVGLPIDFVSSVIPVTGVMCDRVISRAAEKHQIGQQFRADVVDMEGFAALEILLDQVQSVSMLRVISDDAQHDVPDLQGAFDSNGSIKPWVMTRQFLLHPRGAFRLIAGSLAALNQLEHLASALAKYQLREL